MTGHAGSAPPPRGRTVIVTGGAGPVGLAIVRRFVKDGNNVVVCSSTTKKGEAALASLPPEYSGRLLAVGCEVDDPQAVQAALDATVKRFGGVDILVNGAGAPGQAHPGPVPVAEWQLCIGTNLTGTFVFMQEATPFLAKGDHPRIINLGGIDGRTGGGPGGYAIAAAKGGVIALTRAAAHTLAGQGITVNCVAPGYTQQEKPGEEEMTVPQAHTPKIPLGRPATPGDIATAVCFLASREACYITGAVLDVNGGLFMG